MITENDKRDDKFIPMDGEHFNKCMTFALRNGERKISYCRVKDGVYIGGMADTIEDALDWCKKFYSESKCDLCIGDYSGAPCIWGTEDILHEIGVLSDREYDDFIEQSRKTF